MNDSRLKNKIFMVIILALICFSSTTLAQISLTIEECLKKGVENYPLIQQSNLIEQSREYSINNILKNYLPQVSFNAQTSYQSDVTKLPFDLSSLPFDIDIPDMSKDQYRTSIDISQLIWDGGVVNAQRQLIQKNSEVEKQNIEVNLYAVKEKVIQLYFGVLAINKHLMLLNLTEKNLMSSKNLVQSMINNGVATQGDLDLLNVELLNIEKNKIEQNTIKKAYIKMLGIFINQPLPDNVLLHVPFIDYDLSNEINRPELNLYNAQNSIFDIQQKLIKAQCIPKIALFVQGGYGRPGLNLLEDKFKFYALGGVRLSWNISSFYTRENDFRLIEQKRRSIKIQEETFLFNTNLELTKEEAEINKMKELIMKEDEIIELRTRIKESSESKYRNGVYQINDLIRDINAVNQAIQNKGLYEIHYLLKIYNYNYLQGMK